jgi:CRISPR system Cascade subunit CasA
VWERAPLTALPEGWNADVGTDQRYRPPTGPVDLYTWPARRIRLVGTEHEVVGVINAQGDRPTPHNRFDVEPLTAWRYSEPQTKTRGQDTYMPLKHEQERSLWRGLEALLPGVSQPTRANGPMRRLPPALVGWVRRLQTHELVGDGLLTFRAVGVEYGSNESVFDEVVSDEVVLPAALLDVPALATLAVEAVDAADKAVFALGNLVQNVALAAGGSSESNGPRTTASASAYAVLDTEFRAWVRSLRHDAMQPERHAVWHRTVRDVVSRLADDAVDAAGPTALVGRTSGGQFRDAGLAQRWFRKKLREVLWRAFETDDGTRPNGPVSQQNQEVA